MVSIRGYLSVNFTKSFLTVFIPFFFIVSLVYLVKIALLTSQIQISFGELFQLFGYYTPMIIFYALPLSFIVALVSLFLRLSSDNELIALFALGYPVRRIIYPFLLIGILFSVLLITISFGAMPQSKQLYSAFKDSKKSEMAFNIVPQKLGQEYGNHSIYIQDEANGKFQSVVIYGQDANGEDQIFASEKATTTKERGIFSMTLIDGRGYLFAPDSLQEVIYEKLTLYDAMGQRDFDFENISEFWTKSVSDEGRERKMLFFMFVSLIPIASIYIIAAFAIINPRYQQNRSFLISGGVSILFYTIASMLDKGGTKALLLLAIIVTVATGYLLFRRQVARYF